MPIGRRVKIVSISGNASSGSATEIDQGHPWIVALVANVALPSYCKLPANAEIGDVVEVYPGDTQGGIVVQVPSGESWRGEALPQLADGGALCRKVTSTEWAWIRGT